MCINHPVHRYPKKNYLLQQLTKGQRISAYHWKIISLQSDKTTKRETIAHIAHIAVAGLQIKVIGMSWDKPRSTLFKMWQKVGTTEAWTKVSLEPTWIHPVQAAVQHLFCFHDPELTKDRRKGSFSSHLSHTTNSIIQYPCWSCLGRKDQKTTNKKKLQNLSFITSGHEPLTRLQEFVPLSCIHVFLNSQHSQMHREKGRSLRDGNWCLIRIRILLPSL